ncbi:MAG: PDZ domain-containing protein [Phycisphaera sp.]|nr:PDZ domain-containing protein [Phycisphaera sp.]
MNTAIATGRGNTVSQGQFAGIGLAIPMSQIRNVVEQVISTGDVRKGFLGVGLLETDRDQLERLVSEFDDRSIEGKRVGAVLEFYEGDGVMVTRVEPEFPAADAGIRMGDVIEEIDGRRVRGMDQLRSMIASALPGDRVRIGIWRLDESTGAPSGVEIDVVLASSDPALTSWSMRLLQRLGFAELGTMTVARAEALGIEFRRGVVVLQLADANLSPLAEAFPPGSVIYELGGRQVNSLDEFLARLDRGPGSATGRNDGRWTIVGVRPDGQTVEFPFYR